MLTKDQLDTLQLLLRIMASLSIFGSICIFIDVVRNWYRVRAAPSRIVIWWTLASLLPMPPMLLGNSQVPAKGEDPSGLCVFQAVTMQWGFLASSLWAAAMATNIYLAICGRRAMSDILHVERYYHMVAWTVPLAVVLAPLFLPMFAGTGDVSFYGNATQWCWIGDKWASYRLIMFFIPLWIVFAYCFIIYVAVGLEIHRTFQESAASLASSGNPTSARKQFRARLRFAIKTSLYMAAFFLAYFGATTNRVATMLSADGKTTYYGLFILHVLTIPGAGVFNAIVYFSSQLAACVSGTSGNQWNTSGNESSAGAHTDSVPMPLYTPSGVGGVGSSYVPSPIPGTRIIDVKYPQAAYASPVASTTVSSGFISASGAPIAPAVSHLYSQDSYAQQQFRSNFGGSTNGGSQTGSGNGFSHGQHLAPTPPGSGYYSGTTSQSSYSGHQQQQQYGGGSQRSRNEYRTNF
ncbi:hypothetical protein H9P43_001688 [Blastocladiella emersonii ATCC 22665]|nr:hypothetical protein H9P43_001688 [Blastocladiella emersonii ATCC 22665]